MQVSIQQQDTFGLSHDVSRVALDIQDTSTPEAFALSFVVAFENWLIANPATPEDYSAPFTPDEVQVFNVTVLPHGQYSITWQEKREGVYNIALVEVEK